MDAKLADEGSHADALLAGCSHSVHFLVREACSRSSRWLCCRVDERIIGLAVRLAPATRPLIPRGNQLLYPLSPVPVVVDGVHHPKPLVFQRFRLVSSPSPC